MKNHKGFISIGIIIAIVLAFVVVGGGGYYLVSQNNAEQKLDFSIQTEEENNKETQTQEETSNNIENNQTDNTRVIYANPAYAFSIGYPKSYTYNFNEGEVSECFVVESVNSDGVPYMRSKKISLVPGAKLTLSFSEDSGTQKSGVFSGSITYKLSPECNSETIFSMDAIKKPKNFNLSAYLAENVKYANEGFEGSATGGGASLVYVKVNGKSIPVIRSTDASAVINTNDVYYFEGGDYLYKLYHSYGQSKVIDLENRKYYQGDWDRYQLVKSIIENFKFTDETKCESEWCLDALPPTNIISQKPTTYAKIGITKSELEALIIKELVACGDDDNCSNRIIEISEAKIKIYDAVYDGATLVTVITPAYDDSVSSQKYVVRLYNESGATGFDVWHLSKPVETWSCQKGRGHQDFSTENCI